MIDPWDKRSADQFAKLQKDQNVGPLEVVMFSHAHFDHYDGIYHLPDREKFAVWSLDTVARPIAEPALLRAPFLDARPVKFDKTPRDGDTLAWREYRFRFHHLPGQTEFTMGVEAEIDGKRCYFSADNFFHQDMFSGSGGWMGLNRSFPPLYAASAKKVLDAAPEWVLAEHGGPFEFSAEDFRRRVAWGHVSAKAADALCQSGNHLRDWNPHRVHFEPLIQKAKPGAKAQGTLVVANLGPEREELTVTLEGRGLTKDQTWDLDAPAGTLRLGGMSLTLSERGDAGRPARVPAACGQRRATRCERCVSRPGCGTLRPGKRATHAVRRPASATGILSSAARLSGVAIAYCVRGSLRNGEPSRVSGRLSPEHLSSSTGRLRGSARRCANTFYRGREALLPVTWDENWNPASLCRLHRGDRTTVPTGPAVWPAIKNGPGRPFPGTMLVAQERRGP